MEESRQYSRLRQARESRGWTQQYVADQINLSDPSNLRRWESRKVLPSPRFRAALCKLFNMSLDELGLVPNIHITSIEEDLWCPESSQSHQEENNLSVSLPFWEKPLPISPHQKRPHLLGKVHTNWIKGMLEPSLAGTVHLSLQLYEQPDAIIDTLRPIVQRPRQPARPLPPDSSILQIYDDACGELLILGEPGSGKTTLLLELTRDLLQRALQDETHPIPVVFNLASWALKRVPLANWLMEELSDKYQVPRQIGQIWIEHDHILPLLDGLDEVNSTFHQACIKAIADYHQEHGLTPLVVCCRTEEYLKRTARLPLQRAVRIQPLLQQQIYEYLSSAGEQARALQTTICDDVELQRLLTNPLMLHILTFAYAAGRSIEELKEIVTLEEKRSRIFTTYVEQMFGRRKPQHPYSAEQCKRWLAFLARQMKQHNQPEFYLERMQLDWLPTDQWQQVCYGLFIGLWSGLFVTLLVGLMALALGGTWFGAFIVTPCITIGIGLTTSIMGAMTENRLSTPLKKVAVGVVTGMLVGGGIIGIGNLYPPFNNIRAGTEAGLVIGLVFLLLWIRNVKIQPTQTTSWSWVQIRKKLTASLLAGVLFSSAGILLIGGWFTWAVAGLGPKTVVIILSGIVSLLVVGLLSGFSSEKLDTDSFLKQDLRDDQMKPNRGIHLSASSAIRNGLIASLLSGLVLVALVSITTLVLSHLGIRIRFNWVLGELAIVLTTGFVVGMDKGGEACIKHILLRFILWLRKDIPWNYARFLDYATERILLRKIGGGYLFIHPLLRDHFASLSAQPTSRNISIGDGVSSLANTTQTVHQE